MKKCRAAMKAGISNPRGWDKSAPLGEIWKQDYAG
jgi:hypothetical protein